MHPAKIFLIAAGIVIAFGITALSIPTEPTELECVRLVAEHEYCLGVYTNAERRTGCEESMRAIGDKARVCARTYVSARRVQSYFIQDDELNGLAESERNLGNRL